MTTFANFSTASDNKVKMRNESAKFYIDQSFSQNGVVPILVGCTDGFEAHVTDMKKRGFQTYQIVIFEIQHETYLELKKYAEKHYPEIKVIYGDIVQGVQLLITMGETILYIEADGVMNFQYNFDIALIKFMVEHLNIKSLQLVGCLRGVNSDKNKLAKEFNFRKVRGFRIKNGKKVMRSDAREMNYRPLDYIPKVLKSLLKDTDIKFDFKSYSGVNNGKMYMINLKR